MSFWALLASVVPLDLLTGLRITGKYLFRKKVTVQYPEKRLEPTDRFRGMFGFSEERCIVCHDCAKACPIDIIHIDDHFEELEVDGKKKKKKVLDRYDIDVKRCMFCGLCEEACPTKPMAIWLTTKTYEFATLRAQRAPLLHQGAAAELGGRPALPGGGAPGQGADARLDRGARRRPRTPARARRA